VQLVQKLLATRGGTIAVSAGAALLAAVILLVYLHRYRESVNASSKPMTVLVASSLIEKGTPGNVVGSQDLFQVTSTPRSEVKDGAIVDPASLRGQVAAEDIYPGQQLTISDFVAGSTDAVSTKVIKYERGMSIPLDEAHGMIGKVTPGDHVDVIAAFNVSDNAGGRQYPVARTLVQDALVIDAPAESKATGLAAQATQPKSVVLRLTDDEAQQVAFAVENGEVWIVVRPKTGAEQHVPSLVTLERLLLGVKPIPLKRYDGERPWTGGRR
jgi:Flp pilus assembly protein CpaB